MPYYYWHVKPKPRRTCMGGLGAANGPHSNVGSTLLPKVNPKYKARQMMRLLQTQSQKFVHSAVLCGARRTECATSVSDDGLVTLCVCVCKRFFSMARLKGGG